MLEPPPPSSSSPSVKCPFPMCNDDIVPQSELTIVEHFLGHQDFRRVVDGQIQRHQNKRSLPPTLCPFEKCEFVTPSWSLMERHYAGEHRVGHIVFLQFSKTNNWSLDTFIDVGAILKSVVNLVQCSHCYEVMTRTQLAQHIQQIKTRKHRK